MKRVYIYALVDPRTDKVKYIGRTNNPKGRLVRHYNEIRLAPTSAKSKWLHELGACGHQAEMKILAEVDGENADEQEAHWIKEYRNEGYELLNANDGGKGYPVTHKLTRYNYMEGVVTFNEQYRRNHTTHD